MSGDKTKSALIRCRACSTNLARGAARTFFLFARCASYRELWSMMEENKKQPEKGPKSMFDIFLQR